MGAQTTVKVAVLTAAAKNDYYNADSSNLTEDSLKASLNVLQNDPGSAQLYSLEQNLSALSPTSQLAPGTTGVTQNGAAIAINADGTIAYDATALSGRLQALAEGEVFTDTFTYTVRMANGALSTARVTVEIGGENDAPKLAAIAPLFIYDTANDDTPDTLAGTLAGADIDHGAVLAYGIVDNGTVVQSIANEYGILTLDAQSGEYRFTADADKIDSLGEGDIVKLDFTVQVSDEYGASAHQTLTFNLVGANDTAEISGDTSGTVSEDGILSDSGTLSVSDRDAGESGFAAIDPSALHGTYGDFTFDGSTGVWEYALRNADANVQALNATETVYDTLQVSSLDGSASTTIEVAVHGLNDAPKLAAIEAVDIVDTAADDTPAPVEGTLAGTDVDHGAVLSYAIVDNGNAVQSVSNGYGTLSLDAQSGEYRFTADADTIDALKANETVSLDFTVQVSDEYGASAQQTLTFNLVGANDTAEISGDTSGTVSEDGVVSDAGALSVSDLDAGESGFAAIDPSVLHGTYGDFTFNGMTGEWGYNLRNGDANVQALNTGQAVHDYLLVSSLDGSASSLIDVSISGLNEPIPNPVVTYTINAASFRNDTLLISGFDANDRLAYVNKVSYDSTKGISVGDYNADGAVDSQLYFNYTQNNQPVDTLDVVLLGYAGLTTAQIVPA